ncbi:D-alanyl-D-alanine carboxypeptidase family protein [Slackia sp. CM382]|uniref:D-alanyl-D-alanine carboxypeptidase family protein n=1 Tax=Slackia sp. CM382 TaxID=1111137 RepID=UPI000316B312|nr:D-alanyl-D-alanine carboxypeptidase family protein [Slackia sp. CM382]
MIARSFGSGPSMRRCVLGIVAALVLAIGIASPAWADVRPSTDLVLGSTEASRGLSIDNSPDIDAEAALAVTYDGRELFARNADSEYKIASITKIMTAIVALDNASLTDTITVSDKAGTTIGSSAQLRPGDTMSLKTALQGLLVPSGNDAAVAIAETVGARLVTDAQPDPEGAFVDAMNARAAEIGCTDTLFTNPHGLDSDGYESDAHSTAHDVAKMTAYAMQNDTFRSIVGGGDVTVTVTQKDGTQRAITLISTDELLGVYDGMVGVKTGTGDVALNCFAGACERTEDSIYTVVLGSSTEEGRFDATTSLLDWAFDNIQDVDLINSPYALDRSGANVPVVAEVACTAWPDKTVRATVADPDALTRIFAASGTITQDVSYDEPSGAVKSGDKVGAIDFFQGSERIASVDLIAAEDVAAPNIFEGFGIWFARLVADLQGQPSVAASACYNVPTPIMDR